MADRRPEQHYPVETYLRLFIYTLFAALLGTCSSPPPLLDQVLELGQLRVVTRNTPTTYFIGQDGPAGPEFDLVRGFADELGVSLVIETVENVSEVMPRLLSGEAHLAAAGLSMMSAGPFVSYGHPYNSVDMHLIYKLGTGRRRSIEEGVGRSIEVVAGSSHSDMLASLSEVYPGLQWSENGDVEGADLLEKVASGELDFTVADSSDFNIQRHFYPELRVALDLQIEGPIAWAFRKDDGDSLLRRADEYLIDAGREGLLAQVHDRYYGHTEQFDYVGTRAFVRHFDSRLPHYRQAFEEAAEAYGVDWRLMAAIGYQESHWRPHAVSPTGVRGIMMLTQATAEYLDIEDRMDPESSIFGGTEFYALQVERIPDTVAEPDRTWMALAAYNVGFNHLLDARQIVEWQGGDPDAWVDVSKTLPLLARERWYSRVKYGYARGWEPVLYVNNIRNYYNILRWLTANEERKKTEEVVEEKVVDQGPIEIASND